jgi:hypothetical protein
MAFAVYSWSQSAVALPWYSVVTWNRFELHPVHTFLLVMLWATSEYCHQIMRIPG